MRLDQTLHQFTDGGHRLASRLLLVPSRRLTKRCLQ